MEIPKDGKTHLAWHSEYGLTYVYWNSDDDIYYDLDDGERYKTEEFDRFMNEEGEWVEIIKTPPEKFVVQLIRSSGVGFTKEEAIAHKKKYQDCSIYRLGPEVTLEELENG